MFRKYGKILMVGTIISLLTLPSTLSANGVEKAEKAPSFFHKIKDFAKKFHRYEKEEKEEWGNRGYVVGGPTAPREPSRKAKLRKEDELTKLMEKLEKALADVELEKSKREKLEKELADVKAQLEAFRSPKEEPKKVKRYTVKKDDTLTELAEQFYGSWQKWPIIYKANKKLIDKWQEKYHPNLKDDTWIYEGQELIIPIPR